MASRTTLIALSLTLAGCTSAPLVQNLNRSGRRVVLLLDASSSMAKNDPERTAVTGAGVLLGLTGSDDNVGVITYARDAEVQASLGRVTAAKRREVRRRLGEVPREGLTNFGLALERAREMLEEANAPRGSPVILLTDGVPFQGPRSLRRPLRMRGPRIKEVVAQIAARGWRIFAIALGEKASDALLASMVAKTKGAVFAVRDASGLQAAFQGVAVEALGYWTARAARAVPVAPRTARLAFLGTATDEAAIMHDGRPVSADLVRVTRAGKQHRVYLIESPPPGDYSPAGALADAVALVEPRFGVEFAGGIPGELVSGQLVPLGVDLVGDEEAVAFVRPRLRVRARFELADRPWGRTPTLHPSPAADERFATRFRAPKVEAPTPLRVSVEAVLVQDGRAFTLRRTRSFVVKPGEATAAPPSAPPLALTLTPARAARRCWSDGTPAPVKVTLKGDPERAAQLRYGKTTHELAPGATHAVSLPTDAGDLRFRATNPTDGGRWSGRVRVQVTRHRLRPATLALGEVAAGARLDTKLAVAVTPARTLRFGALTLRGPRKTTLRGTTKAGRLALQVPRAAPPGRYAGQLTVEADGLPARTLPVTLTVRPRTVPTLAPLRLRGGWGWVEATARLALPGEAEPVAIELVLEPLAHETVRLDPRWDLRTAPGEGWKGDRLGAAARPLRVRAFLPADAPSGEYRGKLRVRVAGKDRLVLPLHLAIQRPETPAQPPSPAPPAAKVASPALAIVLDRSGSTRLADPQGRARRLLAVLLALGARPGDRVALVSGPGEALGPVTVDATRTALTPLLERLLAATPRPGGADLRAALLEARRRIGPEGTLLLVTDDDLDLLDPRGEPPGSPAAQTREALCRAARARLVEGRDALGRVVALRLPLAQRATPFLKPLGAPTAALGADDATALAHLQRLVWPDAPRIVPRPRPLPVAARVARFAAGAPLRQVGASALWVGDLAAGAELGGAVWAAPAPPPLPAGLAAYRLQNGSIRVGAPKVSVGAVEVARGATRVTLEGTPPQATLPPPPAGDDAPLRATPTLTLAGLRLRGPARELELRPAELVLEAAAPARVGEPLRLQGRAPSTLIPERIAVGFTVGSGPAAGIELRRDGDRLVGTFVPRRSGAVAIVDDPEREVAVRLREPLEIAPAPEPPPPAPPPPPARWPWAVGGGLALLLLLLGGVALQRRRALARVQERLGERQLRTINTRGQLGPERHLLRDHARRDGAVELELELGGLGARLRPDGSLEARGVGRTRLVHPDRPQVLAEQVVLDHGDAFAMVVGDDAVRFVYLEGPPTAEDLTRSYLESDDALSSASALESDSGWGEGDSERLILIDDDMNVPHVSARLDASAEALFPLADSAPLEAGSDSDLVEGSSDEISADSERLLIFDSAEEELYKSQDVEFLSSSDAGDPEEPVE